MNHMLTFCEIFDDPGPVDSDELVSEPVVVVDQVEQSPHVMFFVQNSDGTSVEFEVIVLRFQLPQAHVSSERAQN